MAISALINTHNYTQNAQSGDLLKARELLTDVGVHMKGNNATWELVPVVVRGKSRQDMKGADVERSILKL